MFTKSKVAVVAVISSLTLASSVQAEEMSLESYVSSMVGQAMVAAQYELKSSVQESILNVAYNVSFDEEQSYITHVSINDIEVKNDKVTSSKTK